MDRQPTILVVDDAPDVLEYLEELLAGLGYRTVSARNGREALERVAAAPPDLVLTDITMPVMDGIALCRALKGDEDTRLLPVIIMTALGGLEERILGLEAGADDYLTKPVDHRELTARVQTALRLKEHMDRKLAQLRRSRDHLAKFVPDVVRRLVAANPEAPGLDKRERDLSVLFVDVSGYVQLSQELPPETLHGLIERYFSRYLARLQEARGDITETAGDGFMAVFQHELPPQHALDAASAAVALLDITEALNRGAEHPLAIHIGLNSGPALLGSTRLEAARGDRWTFTASGRTTNLAARLAAAARAGEILAGPETARRIEHRFRIQIVGRTALKGMGEATTLYRVVGPRSPGE